MRIWKVLTIAFLLAITAACEEEATEEPVEEPENEVVENDTETEPVEEVEEPVEEEEVEEVSTEPTETSSAEQEYLEFLALELLLDNFEGSSDVHFDAEYKTFVVTPTDPMFVLEVVNIMETGEGIEEWDNMLNSMTNLSGTLSELLGPGYSLAVGNPLSPDKLLAVSSEGVLIYDSLR